MRTRRWLVAGVSFAVLWVFVRGPAPAPVPIVRSFFLGLAVGIPVAYIFRRLWEEEFDVARSGRAVPSVLRYLLAFTREVIVANVDVAYRVLAPRIPLEPQVILVPLRVETAMGVTTIANSITITPGTITLDHDPDENALYVHVIDGRDPEAVVEPIRNWENYALVIFDEEFSPADPAPEITVHPPDHPPRPKSVRGTERGAEAETDVETDTETDVETEAGTDVGTDAETDAGNDIEPDDRRDYGGDDE